MPALLGTLPGRFDISQYRTCRFVVFWSAEGLTTVVPKAG